MTQVKIPPPLYFLFTFLLGVWLDRHVPLRLGELGWWRPAAGSLAAIAGALALWAMWEFRRATTPILPFKQARVLVTGGPFQFTRNPMYVAMAVLSLGVAVWLRMIWPVVFLPLAVWLVTVLVIRGEEARMRESFGEEFRAYTRRVRRWV